MKLLKHPLLWFGIAVLSVAQAASVYNYFSPGCALSGTGLSQTVNLGTGGSCITGILPASNIANLGANPTALVGLTAVNGTATTYIRSDGSAPISQNISPLWTGNHVFQPVAGTAVQAAPPTGQHAILAVGASGDSSRISLQDGHVGTEVWEIRDGAIANGTLDLFDLSQGASRFQINTAGNVVIPAPASGTAFNATGVNNNYAGIFNGANSATGFGLNVIGNFTGSGTTHLISITDINNSNGVNIALVGNGVATPGKTIRVNAGAFQIINDAYSSAIFAMDDVGGVVLNNATGSSQGNGTLNAKGLFINGVAVPSAILSGTSGSIGGGALIAGQCSSGTTTVTGATTSMVALTDPNTYPGDGTIWDAQVTAANTVTVKVCAIIALTPTASTYNIRVIQ